ncbi:MAG: copper chaperone [Erysipelotrichales bacterium]|nr:MAG: copper chaperone [Erysipelotrichales bacterium]
MKTILFITDLFNEEDVLKLQESLSQTRIDFEVSLINHCVMIEGSNDLVYTAKVAIREAGYTVE